MYRTHFSETLHFDFPKWKTNCLIHLNWHEVCFHWDPLYGWRQRWWTCRELTSDQLLSIIHNSLCDMFNCPLTFQMFALVILWDEPHTSQYIYSHSVCVCIYIYRYFSQWYYHKSPHRFPLIHTSIFIYQDNLVVKLINVLKGQSCDYLQFCFLTFRRKLLQSRPQKKIVPDHIILLLLGFTNDK